MLFCGIRMNIQKNVSFKTNKITYKFFIFVLRQTKMILHIFTKYDKIFLQIYWGMEFVC